MPAIMTPAGALDLQTVLLGNRVIFIGQYINSQVAHRVISQLVTLAAVDEEADILVRMKTCFFFFEVPFVSCNTKPPTASIIFYHLLYHSNYFPVFLDLSELPWWKSVFYSSYLRLHVLGK